MRRRHLLFASVIAAIVLSHIATPAKAHSPTEAPDWGAPGPYSVTVEPGLITKLLYPSNIASSESKHPVIIWGNGTFAVPVLYDGLLRHWASHGFIVAAAYSTQSDTGLEMRAGIDRVAFLNSQPSSPLFRKVDLDHIGASGHSQGGAGAMNAAVDPRVSAVVPIQPGPLAAVSVLHGPTLFLAGEDDHIVPPDLWVKHFYENADDVPAAFGILKGANHFVGGGDAGGFRGAATAWFRYWLMEDDIAGGEFLDPDCRMCTSPDWVSLRRNALLTPVVLP